MGGSQRELACTKARCDSTYVILATASNFQSLLDTLQTVSTGKPGGSRGLQPPHCALKPMIPTMRQLEQQQTSPPS